MILESRKWKTAENTLFGESALLFFLRPKGGFMFFLSRRLVVLFTVPPVGGRWAPKETKGGVFFERSEVCLFSYS